MIQKMLADGRARYTYDAFNRTERVETFDSHVQVNRYDPEGLRHELEEDGKLVRFIFRGGEVVAEETEGNIIRLVRGTELLASDAENARTYYHYASDELGSTTHVADDREVLNHYEYDAWGNLAACGETVPNRFLYTGQQRDPLTRQYYLRARYYNPAIARFTQEDTYRGDGLNLYAYCRNNPVCHVDPSGHDKETYHNYAGGNGESFSDRVTQHVADEIAFNEEHGLTTQYDTPRAEAANQRVEQMRQQNSATNRPGSPAADVPDNYNRVSSSGSVVDRIRSVAQQSYDYAVDNPRKPGLSRVKLGIDAEIQATRWIRRWAEHNGVDLNENSLHFQVRGEHSRPDIIYEPTQSIMDFKLTPKAIRTKQKSNFEKDFPGYSIEYIFGPESWRE